MKIPNIMKVFMYDACINFQIWIYEAYWGKNRQIYFCGPELVMDGWEDREYILGLTVMIRIKIERLIINTTLSYQAISGLWSIKPPASPSPNLSHHDYHYLFQSFFASLWRNVIKEEKIKPERTLVSVSCWNITLPHWTVGLVQLFCFRTSNSFKVDPKSN